MGVAHQVNAALVGLTSNFQTAFQPQLTKAYAAKDYDYLNKLIFGSSKISFFLLFIVSLPIMLNIDWVLSIWLTEVPKYSGTFCNLYIIASILNALATPLWISIFATGKIRNYQITLTCAYFTEILIIYLLFLAGFPPTTAMQVKVGLNVSMVIIRLYFTKREVASFSIVEYLKNVLGPIAISTFSTLFFVLFVFQDSKGIILQMGTTVAVVIISILSGYFLGLTESERLMVKNIIYKRTKK